MRDPNRIYQLCDKLKEYWGRVPDWRFGQLLCNFLGAELGNKDLFYVEDNAFMIMLDKYFNKDFPSPGQPVNNHVKVNN